MRELDSLEQRVALLEGDVAELKRQRIVSTVAKNDWLDEMTGSMKEFPEFHEVLRLGAEWRKTQQQNDESTT